MSLLKKVPSRLAWKKATKEAFHKLPQVQDSIYQHLDPSKSTETGVGAVLAQCFRDKAKLHPVAFSRKRSPAEQNYDIANHELLAGKLDLEEWRHWLEGATYLFMIFTDHKKSLNP